MRCPTLLTPQPKALRRSALIQGKAPFYRRERTVKIITAFQVATNSTAEKACQTRKSGFLSQGAYAEQKQYKHASEHFFSALLHSRHLTILSIVCPPPAQNHLKTSRPEVPCSPAPADFLLMQGSRRRQYSVLSRRMTPQRLKSAAPDRVCIVPVRHPVRDQEKRRLDNAEGCLYTAPSCAK